jgi:hypothetical protein
VTPLIRRSANHPPMGKAHVLSGVRHLDERAGTHDGHEVGGAGPVCLSGCGSGLDDVAP